jgi:H+/gluconate symporter-like permease
MSNMAMHRSLSKTIWLLALPICLGCQMTKVVLVPSGDPVMLAKPVKASVYAFDANKKLVGPSTVTLPAGWYVLPKSQ